MTSFQPPYFPEGKHDETWRDATLTYEDMGRGGTIRFVSARHRFSMWWEFAGGEAIVLVGLPNARVWEQETGISFAAREEVVRFIGDRVLRDKIGSSGRWTWSDPTLTFYK
jgi:hypothetical protein